MRGPLPRRSGYAVVPQLELGVGRLAIALRGMRSCHGSPPDESFRSGTSRFQSCAPATTHNSATTRC
jgi:hypothetical protein